MRNSVVVGVDESKAATRALRWAVDEAHRHDLSLLIVNVPSGTDEEASWKLLNRCAQIASFRQPTVPVSTMSGHGAPSGVLATLSVQAALIVLGARGGDQTERALGSVAGRTAAHSVCPVVIIPESMGTESETGAHRTIAVGATISRAGRRAFEAALLEARNRGVVVLAVAASQGGAEPGEAVLPEELADIADRHTDVTVNFVVRPEEPAEALIAASREADMLVIGCHHLNDPWGARLGPVAAAIVGHVAVPTMVVSAVAETADLNT